MSIDSHMKSTHEEMSMHLSFSLLQQWLKGDPTLSAQSQDFEAPKHSGDILFDRVHTDTRTLQKGDLFVALKGEKFDAHDFLREAKAKGASAAICERGLEGASWRGVQVSDSGKALGVLAAAWRQQFATGVIAVTGSNGKTTVTQMLGRILSAWQGKNSLATEGNFNNAVGVPMTLLRMRAHHVCAVMELGMNHPGEIADLAQWVQPKVALVNNAQREHQEFMESVHAVAKENAQVFKTLPSDGVAVFPIDDDHAEMWQQMCKGQRICRFGSNPKAEVNLLSSQWRAGAWEMRVQLKQVQANFELHLPGQHNVHNALASIACAYSLGVPLEKIQEGLKDFEAVKGRSHFKQLRWRGHGPGTEGVLEHHLGLVDDSYNANPDSVIAAIDLLAGMDGPKVLVLGDMGEVGEQGVMFHQEVGRYASQAGIDCLLALGNLSQQAVWAYESMGKHESKKQSAKHFETVETLMEDLKHRLQDAQSVLVKGSRFMKMERVVQAIMNENKAVEDVTCS